MSLSNAIEGLMFEEKRKSGQCNTGKSHGADWKTNEQFRDDKMYSSQSEDNRKDGKGIDKLELKTFQHF
jgi:hypothetical protein